jgi:FkbM family methyltransferase
VPRPAISYAQRYEDLHLWRCFDGQRDGFYIDVGAGNPVYDNVSFSFYLGGWRGIAVEPNPALAALGRAVRPRDYLYEGLAGTSAGEATLYLQHEFHGLSTTIAEQARIAEKELGCSAETLTRPVTTLAALCEAHAPATFDFLKIDVEGAEADVLRGADFRRFRPKVIVVEAYKPISMAPAFGEWEPLLAEHGYSTAWDDELNRYYVANEAGALAGALATGPASYPDVPKVSSFKPATDSQAHPDHALALALRSLDLAKLPLASGAVLFDMLTAGVADLDRPASEKDFAAITGKLLGQPPAMQQIPSLQFGETVRDAYRRIIDSDAFRAASGRISASYAW